MSLRLNNKDSTLAIIRMKMQLIILHVVLLAAIPNHIWLSPMCSFPCFFIHVSFPCLISDSMPYLIPSLEPRPSPHLQNFFFFPQVRGRPAFETISYPGLFLIHFSVRVETVVSMRE